MPKTSDITIQKYFSKGIIDLKVSVYVSFTFIKDPNKNQLKGRRGQFSSQI